MRYDLLIRRHVLLKSMVEVCHWWACIMYLSRFHFSMTPEVGDVDRWLSFKDAGHEARYRVRQRQPRG